jgi:Zyg-11 family protein
MGLVGNIAEVPELRKDLIRTETIRFYTEALTESGESSLEVAYNACGTLSHLMSDTSTPWPDSLLAQKPEIAKTMCEAIKSWDESAERNINYRSLKPIIHLLKCFHCPEAQTWATWALASLTHGDPDKKYCRLMHDEGGFQCLQDIVNYERTNEFVRGVAQKVIDRVS